MVREFATSKDGTSIPLNIIRRKGAALNGATPLLLTGYGGYGFSLTPKFIGATKRLWLDGGGVFVIANLRGGGEFGETWHEQGALTHKQNVFDDFIASAQYLIAHHYTSPEHLAIIGGSNGGLLMGAAFTQHPELFRAVVSAVGIYDMLRVELDPNGLFNTTEFGIGQGPGAVQGAVRLFALSPRAARRGAYPAIFMYTGATDGRVNPAHSRKMIARLQAATSSGRPVLPQHQFACRTRHRQRLSIRVNQAADVYSFLFDQLGMRLPSDVKRSACSALAVDAVDGFLVGGQRRLMDGFGQRRMRMDGALEVLGARRVFHREHCLGDQFARHGADHVHT